MISDPEQTTTSATERRMIAFAQRDAEALRGALPHMPLGDPAPLFLKPIPRTFSGYALVGEIHRGGQGVVYLARQSGTHRQVAIKVMRSGPAADPLERARFEREIQILAQLRHPNIVTVHDSGAVDGHAYYVMDYVAGVPLDAWVLLGGAAGYPCIVPGRRASKHASRELDDVLRLFGRICEAVNAAHLRGVIHRDLKPANIRIDADGVPHVLDFGLAKDTTARVDDSSAFDATQTGQFIGSVRWASPEQLAGRPECVDIRTDVYSLGVVLYYILSQQFPFGTSGGLPELRDQRVRAVPGSLRRLRPDLPDEVQTIIEKCLSPEPERRYQNAGELGRDIDRFLAGEAIEAKRDSRWYMFRKTVYRYRAAAMSAAIFVLLLLFALGLAYRFWVEAVRQREMAEMQRALAESERQRALEHLERLQVEQERADQAERLLEQWTREAGLQKLAPPAAQSPRAGAGADAAADAPPAALAEAQARLDVAVEVARHERERAEVLSQRLTSLIAAQDPQQDGARMETVSQVLAAAAARAQVELEDQPEVRAAVLDSIARAYRQQGALDDAERYQREIVVTLQEQLGPGAPRVAAAEVELAETLAQKGQLDEASATLHAALQTRRATAGEDDLLVADILTQLAAVNQRRGDLVTAERYAREALATRKTLQGEAHPDTAHAMLVLGQLLLRNGNVAEAEPLFETCLRIRTNVLGEHPLVQMSRKWLAAAYIQGGRFEDAEALLLENLAVAQDAEAADAEQYRAAVEALIHLYEQWNRPEVAAEYAALLPAAQADQAGDAEGADQSPASGAEEPASEDRR